MISDRHKILVSLIYLLRVLYAEYLTLGQNLQTSKKLRNGESVREDSFTLLDFDEDFEGFGEVCNLIQKARLALSLPDVLLFHEGGFALLLFDLELESIDVHRNHLVVSCDIPEQATFIALLGVILLIALLRCRVILRLESHLLFGCVSVFIWVLVGVCPISGLENIQIFCLTYDILDLIQRYLRKVD